MEFKNTDLQYNRILNDMEDEIQRLKAENVNSRHEIQHLDYKTFKQRGALSTLQFARVAIRSNVIGEEEDTYDDNKIYSANSETEF
ncbi:Hypothetical predicted protein, partial [Mytilus galloprovincialis]